MVATMASIKTMGCQPSMKNHRRLKRSEESFAGAFGTTI